ncbi:MAG: hypothetical protein ACR2NO_10505 [Chloroflexota bacterium]
MSCIAINYRPDWREVAKRVGVGVVVAPNRVEYLAENTRRLTLA